MPCEDSIQEKIERAEHIDRQWDRYFGRYLDKPISSADEAWDILAKQVRQQRLTERLSRVEDIFHPDLM